MQRFFLSKVELQRRYSQSYTECVIGILGKFSSAVLQKNHVYAVRIQAPYDIRIMHRPIYYEKK